MSETTLYLVRDPAGNVFGPATISTLRNWQREGRIIASMVIAPQGTSAWQDITRHPGMMDLFGGRPVTAATAGTGAAASAGAGVVGAAGQAATAPAGGKAPDHAHIDKAMDFLHGFFGGLSKVSPMAFWGALFSLAGFLLCCGCGALLGIAGAVMGVLALDRSRMAAGQKQLDPKIRNGALAAIILGVLSLATNCAGLTVMYYIKQHFFPG